MSGAEPRRATMPPACDVAVVGAGPAGAATARHLARSGCRVTLLERSRFDTPRIGESLAPSVQPLLSALGVWARFLALRPLPSYGTRSVWGSATAAAHSHLATPYLSGWHVDRQALDRMLAESAAESGAQLLLGARVVGCQPAANGGATLRVVDARDATRAFDLRADFVVDATGRGSTMARWLGARHALFDRLVAVAALFEDPDAGANCYTLVEATADGWWYAAPAGEGRTVAMLMTDGDLARTLRLRMPGRWRAALRAATATSTRLRGAALRRGPWIVSAVSQRLLRGPAGPMSLSVGDAALSVDPISGSGVVRALRTASAAARAAVAALSGHSDAIASYEAERNEECTEYLIERAGYYDMERRWPGAPFWARRLAVVDRARAGAA